MLSAAQYQANVQFHPKMWTDSSFVPCMSNSYIQYSGDSWVWGDMGLAGEGLLGNLVCLIYPLLCFL